MSSTTGTHSKGAYTWVSLGTTMISNLWSRSLAVTQRILSQWRQNLQDNIPINQSSTMTNLGRHESISAL